VFSFSKIQSAIRSQEHSSQDQIIWAVVII